MQNVKKIITSKIAKTIFVILMIPFIVKILYIIHILGVYFGGFLRSITECIG